MDLAPNIPKALTAYRNHEYLSVRATARAYSLLPTTLRRYLSGGVSHAISHISKQYLSPAEDKVLINLRNPPLSRKGFGFNDSSSLPRSTLCR
ncbi:MAG: hypothetical protein FE78DRAFT_82515 [Acidomyces sp. 'richmondensis']|nr:MAG: hypothetical protein FE78DRAFT_82515 [Acidomyces sp. 'richmondensis']